ncbi:hypothetical protein J5N97_015910 [Dioscorea zingiberensis]|uniref:Uncharacterized protein n=1 Tax=Dioscorea zingiberensis TaxID=325984 RepID=A0A9D5CL09_9LILI|nr:hypothetical protein J5N97_015910 [Dioscorea zingiberensis]
MENNMLKLRSDTGNLASLGQSTPVADANEAAPCYLDQNIVLRPKKFKMSNEASTLAQGGESQGPQRRQDIRWHEKSKTSEKGGDDIFSEVEGFVERCSKLENALSRSRLEKRSSLLDLRVECQDLERFAIINRLGKFHGRGQSDGVESSSAFDSAPRRIFPERYVTALSMTGDHPEGVLCFSL